MTFSGLGSRWTIPVLGHSPSLPPPHREPHPTAMHDDYWSPAMIEQRAAAYRAAEDRRMAKLVEQIDAFLTTVKPGPVDCGWLAEHLLEDPDDVYNAFWRMLNARPCPCGVRSEDCETHADMHEHHTHWPRPARRAEVYDDRGDVAFDRWRDEQLEGAQP